MHVVEFVKYRPVTEIQVLFFTVNAVLLTASITRKCSSTENHASTPYPDDTPLAILPLRVLMLELRAVAEDMVPMQGVAPLIVHFDASPTRGTNVESESSEDTAADRESSVASDKSSASAVFSTPAITSLYPYP
jgi:hypothetical protein